MESFIHKGMLQNYEFRNSKIWGSLGAYRQNKIMFSLVQPRRFEHIHWISLMKYSVRIHKLLLINILNNIPPDEN